MNGAVTWNASEQPSGATLTCVANVGGWDGHGTYEVTTWAS